MGVELSISQEKVVEKYTKEVLKEYENRTKKSKKTFEHGKKFLPGGNSRSGTYWEPYPTYFERGKGFTIWDIDGNSYIDFINNYTALIHGHAHPKIVKAIQETIEGGTAYNWPTEYAIKLGEMLCERIPSFERVRFTNSGTEGTLNTIRLAIAFTGRDKILKAEGAYHGTHLSVDVSIGIDPEKAGSIENPNSVLERGTPKRVAKETIIFPFNNEEITEKIFKKNKDDLAALIVEPLCRMIQPEDDFLKFLREITIENDVLLIFDEVISSRIGRGGAQKYYGVTPDLTAIGKIYGGGTPFGAFGGREDIMMLTDPSRDKYVSHAGTFNANPLTMAAGVAATEMLTPSAFEKLNSLGEVQRKGVRRVLDELGIIAQLTGEASLLRIHFTTEKVKDIRSAKFAAKAKGYLYQLLFLSMLNRGVSIAQAPRLYTALSTVITEKEIQTYINTFRKSLEWMKPLIKETDKDLIAY